MLLRFATVCIALATLLAVRPTTAPAQDQSDAAALLNGDFEDYHAFYETWMNVYLSDKYRHQEGTETVRGISNVAHSGDYSAAIHVSADSPAEFHSIYQDVEGIQPGQHYKLSFWVRTDNVQGGVGAMGGFGCIDEATDERAFSNDTERFLGTNDWRQVSRTLFVPEGYSRLRVILLQHGTGTSYFDDVRLELIDSWQSLDAETVSVKVTDEVVCDQFMGFGYEDDPFFWTEENFSHGITEEDLELRQRRIREMDADVAAILFWWHAICPSRDLSQITYDTEQMRALYKCLESLQREGITTIMSDVFWGWEPEQMPYYKTHLEQGVDIYADVYEHFIKEKGYDVLRVGSISGEVDMRWVAEFKGTFETYCEALLRFKEGLRARDIGHVMNIGDKVSGTDWFSRVTQAMDPYLDIFTVHEYPHRTQSPIAAYRLREAREAIESHSAPVAGPDGELRHKPVFCWEIGYLESNHNDMDHQGIRRFDYGLLCARTCLGILNEGLVGGSVWCLHSMYYPGGDRVMDFGFWEFKDTDWAIRPFYYGYGMITRFTDPGMVTLRVEKPTVYHDFDAAAMRDEAGRQLLFLLNQSPRATRAELEGLDAGRYRVYEYAADRIPEKGDPLYEKIAVLDTGKVWQPGDGPLDLRPETLVALRRVEAFEED